MKRLITKAQIRSDMDKQIADFLNKGGKVAEVERGISGRENPNGPLKPDNSGFQQPKVGRTYVPEVIAALDARRNPKAIKPQPKTRRTRKKMIYDDFGEPLRWEWVEE
ncbi:MAG: hypothetical protein WCY88_14480 [Spongiibacteraceae bacterium]